jgi:hypothetical protein
MHLPQCRLVHHKVHTHCSGVEPGTQIESLHCQQKARITAAASARSVKRWVCQGYGTPGVSGRTLSLKMGSRFLRDIGTGHVPRPTVPQCLPGTCSDRDFEGRCCRCHHGVTPHCTLSQLWPILSSRGNQWLAGNKWQANSALSMSNCRAAHLRISSGRCNLTHAKNYVRFEVFTAVTMKSGVFWDITPCGSCNIRRFGGT